MAGADPDRSGPQVGVAGGGCMQQRCRERSGPGPDRRDDPWKAEIRDTPTQLLRALGRSEFTVREMAERTGLSVEAARGRLSRYLEAELVERTPYVQQYVDAGGRPMRGRPAHLYRVR